MCHQSNSHVDLNWSPKSCYSTLKNPSWQLGKQLTYLNIATLKKSSCGAFFKHCPLKLDNFMRKVVESKTLITEFSFYSLEACLKCNNSGNKIGPILKKVYNSTWARNPCWDHMSLGQWVVTIASVSLLSNCCSIQTYLFWYNAGWEWRKAADKRVAAGHKKRIKIVER